MLTGPSNKSAIQRDAGKTSVTESFDLSLSRFFRPCLYLAADTPADIPL
jgi:hypothetical protein